MTEFIYFTTNSGRAAVSRNEITGWATAYSTESQVEVFYAGQSVYVLGTFDEVTQLIDPQTEPVKVELTLAQLREEIMIAMGRFEPYPDRTRKMLRSLGLNFIYEEY